ncbi:hypothetical protein I6A60_01690 [Frankia sp. AgB1.9]|uniref:hypothetical protein n=1 Tax=unclassified Frankia TaxID=2632575 RepID=UPI0019321BDD|nr:MULTISPECIES: hypothetical protein [unclassified Frankia]MBL7491319.1 hypothetical protein [Frankia sp. AgW1.1]MBL7546597.1 hypothetical protein [Frankia sp. AgB1.9]MBL7624669.1 hypothetical protein [Frankia sp. AgB1.8]
MLVVSDDSYNRAATGRVIACPIVPGRPAFPDYATVAILTDPVEGTVLPELVAWEPVSGLSHPLGPVPPLAWARVDQALRRLLGH